MTRLKQTCILVLRAHVAARPDQVGFVSRIHFGDNKASNEVDDRSTVDARLDTGRPSRSEKKFSFPRPKSVIRSVIRRHLTFGLLGGDIFARDPPGAVEVVRDNSESCYFVE